MLDACSAYCPSSGSPGMSCLSLALTLAADSDSWKILTQLLKFAAQPFLLRWKFLSRKIGTWTLETCCHIGLLPVLPCVLTMIQRRGSTSRCGQLPYDATRWKRVRDLLEVCLSDRRSCSRHDGHRGDYNPGCVRYSTYTLKWTLSR